MTATASLDDNRELVARDQTYDGDPLAIRATEQYRDEYVMGFAEKWDELIDWEARADSEGAFFIDVLRSRGKHKILDVACGTGFHSVRLVKAGFDVTSVDGSAAMLAKAFENAREQGIILKAVHADWRWLNRAIQGKYDAVICLGNSFTHLFDEGDRRRVLAEFYAALKHDGVLIIDQRNYDAIIDKGFSSKHKYYYCGDKVTAEPEYVDEGLARFRYSFPDGTEYNLNMFPLRKNYLQRLLREAGFQRIHSYGDFQEESGRDQADPDFLVHVAEKAFGPDSGPGGGEAAREASETYYDSADADRFYFTIWGGEDIHVGLYDETTDIRTASRRTVERMASAVPGLGAGTRVLDIGAGYGGAARHLARAHGAKVTCLNVSETQNARNRALTEAAGLGTLVSVVHGSFEAIPEPDASFEIVWSQDAILHSGDRAQVFREVARVLEPGGSFVLTDPMQADDVPAGVLQPVYDRLQLADLGSVAAYKRLAAAAGLRFAGFDDLSPQLRTHYFRVREELVRRSEELAGRVDPAYLERMIAGLGAWVEAADAGHLKWGILRFTKS